MSHFIVKSNKKAADILPSAASGSAGRAIRDVCKSCRSIMMFGICVPLGKFSMGREGSADTPTRPHCSRVGTRAEASQRESVYACGRSQLHPAPPNLTKYRCDFKWHLRHLHTLMLWLDSICWRWSARAQNFIKGESGARSHGFLFQPRTAVRRQRREDQTAFCSAFMLWYWCWNIQYEPPGKLPR